MYGYVFTATSFKYYFIRVVFSTSTSSSLIYKRELINFSQKQNILKMAYFVDDSVSYYVSLTRMLPAFDQNITLPAMAGSLMTLSTTNTCFYYLENEDSGT